MAITGVTLRGSAVGTSNGTTLSRSPTANITVGKILIAVFGGDNIATATGDASNHSIADSKGNVWTKLYEKVRTAGAANDGAQISAFLCRVTTQINTTDTVTVTTTSSISDRHLVLFECSVGAGNTLLLEQIGVNANGTTYNASVSGMPSREYLLFAWSAAEGEDNAKTPDAAPYTELYDALSTTAGNLDVNISAHLQTRVATLTGDTANTSAWTGTDVCYVLAALYENPAPVLLAADGAELSVNYPLLKVGNSLSLVTDTSATIMTHLTTTRIALYYDVPAASDEIRVYDWNGTNWSQVGTSYTDLNFDSSGSFHNLNSTDIVLACGGLFDKIQVLRFNGTTFAQLGNALSFGGANTLGVAALSSTRVAVLFDNLSTLTLAAYDWDGTDFTLVGNVFTVNATSENATRMAGLNGNSVVFYRSGTTSLDSFVFDGTNWTAQGTLSDASEVVGRPLVISSTQWLSFNSADYIKLYNFNGTNITLEKTISFVLATSSAAWLNNALAIYDVGWDELRYYEFNIWGNADFSVITTPPPSSVYNGNFFQFF